MLDLNNLILNSSSPVAQDNTDIVQFVDLADLSNDENIASSFESMFTELLDSAPVEIEEVSEDDPVLTDTNILQQAPVELATEVASESPVQITDQAAPVQLSAQAPPVQVSVTTQDVATNAESQTANNYVELKANPILPETSASLNSLENNVAMAWINSESFQPPESTAVEKDEVGDFSLDLDAVAMDESIEFSDADIEKVLSKTIQDTKAGSSLVNDAVKSSTASASETIKSLSADLEQLSVELPQNTAQVNNLVNKGNQQTLETKTLSIPVDIGTPEWADKFSEHIVWLGQQGIKSALIKIHPEDLGPLEISIKVVKDSATVSINSDSGHARDVVNDSLPRLREMMAEQGITLADVHVGSDKDTRQSSKENHTADEAFSVEGEEEVQFTPIVKKAPKGLIDYFA